MTNIFIKNITIQNYKCFENDTIQLHTPDGQNEGSGLNILVGENGNGKTTILEAINYLTQSSYSSENKLSINDFRDKDRSISIKGMTDEFRCDMPYPKNYYEANGLEFIAKSRDRKAPGKLLSSVFQINNYFLNVYQNYKNARDEDSGNPIQALHKTFSNDTITDGSINIFYFDKNRSRQIVTGTFKTTFDKICDDLNWKFAKGLTTEKQDAIIQNIAGEYFKNVLEAAQKGTGQKLAQELKDFFGQDDYANLKIELLDLLHPFSKAFFAIRKDNELKQIAVRDLGSGIEMVLTLLLLRIIASDSKGSVLYLLDEPELHLHPKAQEKLVELLVKESKDKQIIVSTHSPYIFKHCLNDKVGVMVLNRNATNNIEIKNANTSGWSVLPWGPSWGEINFHAYDLPTIDLHNELYGYLQEKENQYSTPAIETFLVSKGISKTKSWIRQTNGTAQPAEQVTLPTYVRHSIHHPENTHNAKFTSQELKESIDMLIGLLR